MYNKNKTQEIWSKIVDYVTVLWFVIFFVGLLASGYNVTQTCKYIGLGLLSVFILDLIFLYKRTGNFRLFLKQKWLDILMVIPYFRIFRILRILRFVRLVKIIKLGKVSAIFKRIWGVLKAFRKSKRIKYHLIK